MRRSNKVKEKQAELDEAATKIPRMSSVYTFPPLPHCLLACYAFSITTIIIRIIISRSNLVLFCAKKRETRASHSTMMEARQSSKQTGKIIINITRERCLLPFRLLRGLCFVILKPFSTSTIKVSLTSRSPLIFISF